MIRNIDYCLLDAIWEKGKKIYRPTFILLRELFYDNDRQITLIEVAIFIERVSLILSYWQYILFDLIYLLSNKMYKKKKLGYL